MTSTAEDYSVTTRRYIEARRLTEKIKFEIESQSLPGVRLYYPFLPLLADKLRNLSRFASSSPPEEWIFLLPNEFWDSEFGFWHFPVSSVGWKGITLALNQIFSGLNLTSFVEAEGQGPIIALNERQSLILQNSSCLVVNPPSEFEVLSMIEALLLEVETTLPIRDELTRVVTELERKIIPDLSKTIPRSENVKENYRKLSQYYFDLSVLLHRTVLANLKKKISMSLIVDHGKRLLRDKTPDEWASTDLLILLDNLNSLTGIAREREIRKIGSLIIIAGLNVTSTLNNKLTNKSDNAILISAHQRFSWNILGNERIKWALTRQFLQPYFADEGESQFGRTVPKGISHPTFRENWKKFITQGKVWYEIRDPGLP